jgi:DNA invertase Pin-like site-specific DNA recombinase
MKYNVESVIKRLQAAKDAGNEYVSEDELSSIVTPQINNIDEVIKLLDKGIAELQQVSKYVSILQAEKLTEISRQTFYRWKNEGIIQCCSWCKESRFDLEELRDTLIQIKRAKR